jgi:hypothetical protein
MPTKPSPHERPKIAQARTKSGIFHLFYPPRLIGRRAHKLQELRAGRNKAGRLLAPPLWCTCSGGPSGHSDSCIYQLLPSNLATETSFSCYENWTIMDFQDQTHACNKSGQGPGQTHTRETSFVSHLLLPLNSTMDKPAVPEA